MEHWSKDLKNSADYFVEFDGTREGPTCIEAQVETKASPGFVIREWEVPTFGAPILKRKKFYGKVFIVRCK